MKRIILLGIAFMALAVAMPQSASAYTYCVYPNYEDESGRCVGPSDRSNNPPYYAPAYGYRYNVGYGYQSDVQLLEMYIQRLRDLLAQLEELRDAQYGYNYGDTRLEVTTNRATNIDENSARLHGEVDYNGEDEAEVYFEWGDSRSRLDERTSPRTLYDGRDTDSFSYTINRLDANETYYFRAVAVDEDGDKDLGSIREFKTDRDTWSNGDDEPEVETGRVTDITDDSAEIYGNVDMNDFSNGLTFFVWGEDEDQVADIEDDYREYSDIDEDGDDLQKIKVDDDVDNSAYAWANIYDLAGNTRIYYSFCVEYEDEDNDQTIACGGVEDFRTD